MDFWKGLFRPRFLRATIYLPDGTNDVHSTGHLLTGQLLTGQLFTRQMLTGQLLTEQLLTRQLLTKEIKKRTVAHPVLMLFHVQKRISRNCGNKVY